MAKPKKKPETPAERRDRLWNDHRAVDSGREIHVPLTVRFPDIFGRSKDDDDPRRVS